MTREEYHFYREVDYAMRFLAWCVITDQPNKSIETAKITLKHANNKLMELSSDLAIT